MSFTKKSFATTNAFKSNTIISTLSRKRYLRFYLPTMPQSRRQLTLFLRNNYETIERIRATFNPVQHSLIAAHVTLCRDEEIESIEGIIENMTSIQLKIPITMQFDAVERFADGKGVWIPAKGLNNSFQELRKIALGVNQLTKNHLPHITLMHPRNATCTDEIFEQIRKYELPSAIDFDRVSLIEQMDGSKWETIQEFLIIH
jgi:2'-5' RNA ligase